MPPSKRSMSKADWPFELVESFDRLSATLRHCRIVMAGRSRKLPCMPKRKPRLQSKSYPTSLPLIATYFSIDVCRSFIPACIVIDRLLPVFLPADGFDGRSRLCIVLKIGRICFSYYARHACSIINCPWPVKGFLIPSGEERMGGSRNACHLGTFVSLRIIHCQYGRTNRLQSTAHFFHWHRSISNPSVAEIEMLA